MKKSLCAFWLLILLPFGLVQAAEFKLTGRTTWQLGQLMVNGIPFVIDERTRFKDGLDEDDLGGTWVDLEGVVQETAAGRGGSFARWRRWKRRTRWNWKGRWKGDGSGAMSPRMGASPRSRDAGWSWSASLTACA